MSTRSATSPAAQPAARAQPRAAARRRALQRRRPRLSRLLAWLLAAWLGHGGLALAQVAPGALPSGGQVMVGSGQLQLSPNLLVIQQNSQRLGIDWQSFHIGSGAMVEFRQPGSSSVALNRVVGHSGSEIYGRLKANGQVFLTNPNGVLFAPDAQVDVGGLVASTLDLSQQDFADGRYVFSAGGAQQGRVVNHGSLNASAGGYLALFGQTVDNQGDITVSAGSVVLAAGRAATVSISGSGLISAVVTPGTAAGRVDNAGRISADGGVVTLSAKSAQDIAASLVNNSGIVRANTLVDKGGEIWITGDHVSQSGTLSAAAPSGGDGGRVMVLADMAHGTAQIGGTLDASSATGSGGFVETSAARVNVGEATRVTTAAGGGRTGTWLIDPNDYTVASSGGNITGATLSANLAASNVQISTLTQGTAGNGDIFVNDAVTWADNRLLLTAERHIAINAALTGSGIASLGFEYGQAAPAAGNASSYTISVPISLRAGPSFSTKLGSDGVTQSYTVITDASGLQAVDGLARNLNFALGAGIDLASIANFNPIGNEASTALSGTNSFSGRFDGLGNTISGLSIDGTAASAGLFATTSGADIRNLTLSGGSVKGAGHAGALAGILGGSTRVTHVRSTVAVSTSSTSLAAGGLAGQSGAGSIVDSAVGTAGNLVTLSGGNHLGGLVGQANGTAITHSSAAVALSGAATYMGGLVGQATGAIAGSSSSGTAQSTANSSRLGGLVGETTSSVASSTSSMAVTATGASAYVGGLVGFASGGSASVADSTARGDVNGGGRTGGLVGYQTGGSIGNSHAEGNVSGDSYVGGLVGDFVNGGNISGSTATGSASGGSYVGGLVGSFYNAGSVNTSVASGSVSGTTYVGGLLGAFQYSQAVTDSRATGNVSSSTSNGDAGGLIGYAYSNAGGINNSSAAGSVIGRYMVGGLVGELGYTQISRGTATGSVRAVSDSYVYVGGLVGYAYHSGTSTAVSDSSADGAVFVDAGGGYIGGLMGYSSSLAITNGTARGAVTVTDSRNANNSNLYAGGLVGYYAAGSNAGISNSRALGHVAGGYYAGGLAGHYNGNSAAAGIVDSSASGHVSGGYYVGGLVGELAGTGINNGRASGNVTSTFSGSRAGGLVGEGYASYDGASINDSSASGHVSGVQYAGGLVGNWQNQLYQSGSAGISNSRASGNVTASNTAGGLVGRYSGYYYGFAQVDLGIRNGQASGSVSASQHAGGLVGDYFGFGGIGDSSATGSVTGTSGTSTHYLGGLVGSFQNYNSTAGAGTISRSYASGSVALAPGATLNASTTVFAGGLVGELRGYSAAAVTAADSYASGAVTLAMSTANGRLFAGGLVGNAIGSLDNVYSTGAVSASGGSTRTASGLVAQRNSTSVTATDSYWATDTSGQAASVIGTAKTLAELKAAATFSGWDIAGSSGSTSPWRIYEGYTTPLLRSFLTPLALTLVDASKTYDGTSSLAGATVNSSGGPVPFPERILIGGSGTGADAGIYALGAGNFYSVQDGYDLNLAGSAQLTIHKKTLTLDGLVAGKVYDATTAATLAAGAQPGGLVTGEALLFQPAGDFAIAFASKNAGTARTVNVTGSYTWADGTRGKVSNYVLPTASTTTADIAKATLTAGSFSATSRAYDGSTTVAVSATAATLSGVLGNDSVTVDLSSVTSGSIADRHVGTGKAVTVLGASISGSDAANYALAGIDNTTVDITPRAVTVNGIIANNRAYDRSTSVSLNTSNLSLSGVIGSDQLAASNNYASGTVADKNVGDGKPVTVTGLTLRGADAANYTPQQGSVSVNITPRPVTVYAQRTTATDRVYDGSTAATVALYNDWTYSTSNLWAGDSVTLSHTGIAYDTKNVAYTSGGAVTSKTITVSGLSLSGSDAGNYALQSTTATTTGTITPRALPVTGITATSRTYDATRDVQVNVAGASVDTSVVVAGDNVSVVIPSAGTVTGQVADKNVGTGKAVTVPGLTITGADAGNYTVNNAANGVTVDITRKPLTAVYTALDKVYDGDVYATMKVSSADIVSGDSINFYIDQSYCGANACGYALFTEAGRASNGSYVTSRHVGTDKPVVITYNQLVGNDAGNYTLLNPTGPATGAAATADITPKPVTLAFNGTSKVYDGSIDATVSLNRGASGVFSGDTLTTTQTAVYTGATAKNVGTGKAISITGISMAGAHAGNYTVSNTTATTTGTVTAKPITLSGITAVDRAYDGTTTVQVSASSVTSSGFVDGDEVTVVQPAGGLTTGTIANKNVGSAKPVTVTGLSLAGTDAANYSIDLAGSGITVNIGQKALTPTYTGISRVYNGGVSVGVTPTTAGIEAGDTVTFSQQAVFSGGGAKNVGTAKPIAISLITLGGASAANYSLTATTATATADVTPKPMTVDYIASKPDGSPAFSRVYNGMADTSISVLGSSLQLLAGDLVDFTQSAVLLGDGGAGVGKAVSVSGIALTGQDAANYSLLNTTATTTATITPRPLGVTGITATPRVYDGTTTVAVNVAGATVDTSALIAGDSLSVTIPGSGISTGTMADRHVGNAKPVTITGLAISGPSAGNYSLIGATGLTVDITPRSLTASYAGVDKIYDGSTTAQVTGSSGELFAVDVGLVQINAIGSYTGPGARNVGTDKVVTVRDGFLSGAARDNYTLSNPTGSTTASITPRQVSASYTSGLSKVYDGGVSAPASGSIVNGVAGDSVSLTQTAEFTGPGARNVGNGKPIEVTGIELAGADAGNYTLGNTTASTVGHITPKSITVAGLSNVTAVDRVYDGSVTVSVNVPAGVTLVPTSTDIVAGDVVTIEVPVSGVTTGSMSHKNVGTGKAVTIDGLSLSGADGGNYRIAGTAGITVSISAKPLTASYAGVSRVYDGTLNANVTGTSADIVSGDNVVIGGSGVFNDAGGKNVGTGKTISVQQARLSGSDGANYSLVNPTGSATGSVTPRSVTASYTSPGRIYDGGTAAPVDGSAAFIFGDQVSLTQTAVFAGVNAKNVGDGKAIQVSGIALAGGDAVNYTLTGTTASTQGSIRPRPIGILGLTGVTAQGRAYDGTTAVTVEVQSNGTISVNTADIVAGDDVNVTVPSAGTTTGVVADKNVGNAKPVTVTGLALSGQDAANYTISAASGLTVDITPRALTAVYGTVTRVYDGSTAAAIIGSSADLIAGDALTIGGSGVFTGSGAKNVGSGKPVDVLSATLAGADAANYSLVNPSGSTSGSITPRSVSVSYLGGTRVYDGSVVAPVTGMAAGVIAGDDVVLAQTAQFTGTGAKNVGTGKAVSITGVTLGGTDAANYELVSSNASTTAAITPRPLRIEGFSGVVATDRVYDGSTAVAISIQGSGDISPNAADVVVGDDVTVVAPPSGAGAGTMADKHVGNNKPVTVGGLTLAGADAGNYSVAAATGVTVNITPLTLSAVYTGQNKVYDGTATAALLGSAAGLIAGDAVTITGSGLFTGGKDVGTGKAIAVTGGVLTGADARNYSLLNATGSTSADITPRPLTPTYAGSTRVYDGSTDATVTPSVADMIAGDDLRFTQTAAFSGVGARNVGVDKPVTVSGITLQGADAANYLLTATTAATTGTITPRPLNVSGLSGLQAVDRVYDGTRDVQITGSLVVGSAGGDVIAGDDVAVVVPGGSISAGTMVDKAAGLGKAVAVSGLSLSGADAPNYRVTGVAGLTVNIAPRPVALLGVSALGRIYDGSDQVAIDTATGRVSGVLAGDDLQLRSSGVTGRMADKNAGTGKAVTVDGLSLGGADAANYTVEGGTALRVDIAPRDLIVTATAADKVYDGNTAAGVTLQDDRLAGDTLNVATTGATFAGKDAGAGLAVSVAGLSLSGTDAGNYRLLVNTLSTTATIQRAPLTVSANSLSKVYGESVNLTGAEFTTLGLVAGESLGLVTLASAGLDASAPVAGSPYTVVASDARGGSFNPANYVLGYTSGSLTVAPRPLTIAANSVVRSADEANPASFGFSTSVGGLFGSDSIASVQLAAPAGSANAPGGSIFELQPGAAVFGSGQADNYAIRYDSGLLVVLPTPPRLDDVNPGGDPGQPGFAIEIDPVELEQAFVALRRTAGVVAQVGAGSPVALPADLRAFEAAAADIQVALAGDSRRITLPALLRLPLISYDPSLRRLLFGVPEGRGTTPTPPAAP